MFWKKARIPTRKPHRCKNQEKKRYDDWKKLLRNKNKKSEILKQKKQMFSETINDDFDIFY